MASHPITIYIPDSVLQAENSDAGTFAHELCLLAAIELYEIGRFSSGRAAELAGMTRVEFLSQLSKYQVFPLEAELEELEKIMPQAISNTSP
ncbi:MAG: UPF0175 family protein [Elainellaceae cyanobacterium]